VSWHGSTGDAVGYGVMLHLPNSLSVCRADRDDTDLSALLSADLGKLFTNRRGLYEKIFN